MDNFYVYEHIRLDNNTPFYVGKGRGKRAYSTKRNTHHDKIAEKYGMKVHIIADHLSEKDAFDLESFTIIDYVINKDYGIDIDGYRKPGNPKHLTNLTFGGDGVSGNEHSEEWKEQHSKRMSGENNPMFNVNVWSLLSEERAKMAKEKLSKCSSGKNNPMFGVSPRDRMSPQKYQEWLDHQRSVPRKGKDNPNYGNNTLHEKIKDRPDLRIKYYSRPGTQNGRARPISVYDKNMNFLKHFDYIGACCEWLKSEHNVKASIQSIRQAIPTKIKQNKTYYNLYFKYE